MGFRPAKQIDLLRKSVSPVLAIDFVSEFWPESDLRNRSNELCDDDGQPIVRFGADTVTAGKEVFAARRAASEAIEQVSGAARAPDFIRPAIPLVEYPPLRVRPSSAVFAGTATPAECYPLGDRLSLTGDPDMQVIGEVFHRFFACDDPPTLPSELRLARADGLRRRWSAPQLAAADLVAASNRLHAFLSGRFGNARRLVEWPVHAIDQTQIIAGRIDLLIELPDGFAVVDHKSFPGTIGIEGERLQAFAGQMSLYARALERLTGRACREYWLHQPVAGLIRKVTVDGG